MAAPHIAVTLALSLTGVPAGIFTVSASTVTVPAGGTVSVTVTADTRVNVPDARYGGQLIASAGQTVVSTPFAVDKEPERYHVSLVPLDRSGQPAQASSSMLIDTVNGAIFDAYGAQTVRVPRGRYILLSNVYEAQDITMLAEPEIVVDRDITEVVDARHARPISISLPMQDASPQRYVASAVVRFPDGGAGAFLAMADPGTTIHTGSSDPSKNSPNLTGSFTALYTAAGVEPIDSPYVTEVAWREPGRVFQGAGEAAQLAGLGDGGCALRKPGMAAGMDTVRPHMARSALDHQSCQPCRRGAAAKHEAGIPQRRCRCELGT
jgi:hypothetical protein